MVGAGHLKGLANALSEGIEDPEATTQALDHIPPGSNVPWFSLIVGTLLLATIGWGFYRGGVDLGAELVLDWVVITAIGGAVGAAAARAHPLSILAAAVCSPITPLLPALSSGMVSAFVEAWLRKPTYQDMLDLRQDTATLGGWWRNRFARVIVNFVLANTGHRAGGVDRRRETGARAGLTCVSFELFLQRFSGGHPAGFTAAAIRDAFGDALSEVEEDFWQVGYGDAQSSDLFLAALGNDPCLFHNVSVYRPCTHPRLYESLWTLLGESGSVLHFPGDSPPLARDPDIAGHLPPTLLQALGTPLQLRDPAQIVRAIEAG